jgi:hypothetical protein
LDANLTSPTSAAKEERNSDLLIDRDALMDGDVDMAIGGEECDQDH